MTWLRPRRQTLRVRLLTPLLALGLLGCAANPPPYAPVRDVRYTALGHDPFWLLTIGDESMVLTLGEAGGRADGGLGSFSYPRVLPRTENGVQIWESSADGTAVISIEARPGTCRGSGGMRYEHNVRVRLSGRELNGCGGRELGAREPGGLG